MREYLQFLLCGICSWEIGKVVSTETIANRNVKNFTYLDCYEMPPYKNKYEVSVLIPPYPGHWTGLKGPFHRDQCLLDCQNGNFLYAAITSLVVTNETLHMICSCGNTRPYMDQRPPYCHWRCGYPDDPRETWCAYPNFHKVSRVYAIPEPEYPETAFVGCVQDLLEGPVITERASWKARIHVFGLWLVKFYAEDCAYDCQWKGYRFIGIHSYWNGKTMMFSCRCGHDLPKRQDVVRETFCPWRCTYYNRHPQRWCSYHADKWWSAVYMIVDDEHPRRLATPHPTPVPMQPEEYIWTTVAMSKESREISHKPMAPLMSTSDDIPLSTIEITCVAVAGLIFLTLITLCVVMIHICRRPETNKETHAAGCTTPSIDIVEINHNPAHIIPPDNDV